MCCYSIEADDHSREVLNCFELVKRLFAIIITLKIVLIFFKQYFLLWKIPVCMHPGFSVIYRGAISPIISEDPMMTKFRLDLSDTNCRLDRPTEVTMPKLTSTIPPYTGSGSRVRIAPNFPLYCIKLRNFH